MNKDVEKAGVRLSRTQCNVEEAVKSLLGGKLVTVITEEVKGLKVCNQIT